jgi:hypothetical protein
MPAPLFENDHVVVDALTEQHIVTVTRKPTRVELDALDGVWGAAERALAMFDRRQACLLVDVSAAVGRNDEQFEQAFAPFRRRLCSGWLELALVVSSLPGKLQVQRYAREDEVRVPVFEQREEALTALRQALSRR